MEKRRVVIGMDGGGTHIRVAVADRAGNLLSYVDREGAASLHKDLRAKENAHNTLREAVEAAGCRFSDAAAVVAGIAGLDSEADLAWATELTAVPGLACPARHVNDAVAAHAGAFLTEPGVIAIAGTGSIVFAVTEAGAQLRNYDFHHYAEAAARHLAYRAVYAIIAGETDESDAALTAEALRHFGVKSIDALSALGADGFTEDWRERAKWFGDFGPCVTQEALRGSQLAGNICEGAADALATGVRLLGSRFASNGVRVALIGAVANSEPVKRRMETRLKEAGNRQYAVAPPALPPVLGAVIMALSPRGEAPAPKVLDQLTRTAREKGLVYSC